MSDLQDALDDDERFFAEQGFPRLEGHQLIVKAARLYANPEDELWWCKAHARAIDTFDGLTPKTCLYDGRPGHCDPASALIVLGITTEDTNGD